MILYSLTQWLTHSQTDTPLSSLCLLLVPLSPFPLSDTKGALRTSVRSFRHGQVCNGRFPWKSEPKLRLKSTDWLTDWLTDWQTDWVIEWLTDRQTDWLTGQTDWTVAHNTYLGYLLYTLQSTGCLYVQEKQKSHGKPLLHNVKS